MADGGDAHTLRYSAFISYSHRDAAFARSLHRRLETYRLPRNLRLQDGAPGGVGQTSGQAFGRAFGRKSGAPLARRLRPIFRDRDELPAASDLTAAVQDAIAQSRAMIVVCSPAAAGSVWVAREVAAFRRAHGDGAVLAALIEGDETTAFPAGLCGAAAGGGLLQPLAADFRKEGDGPRLALLKLVAVLAGVRLDALVQRDAARRVRVVSAAAAAALAGLAVMTALTWVAVDARVAAEKERNRGETLIGFMLTDLRGKLKGVGRLDLLDAVNKGALEYYRDQDLAHMPVSALEQRAQLLQAMGEDDEKRGKFEEARAQFEEALRTTTALLAASPDDTGRIYAQSQSEYWVGDLDWRMGAADQARAAFQAYADLTTKLLSLQPRNLDWTMEVGEANFDLGMVILRQSRDLNHAEMHFEIALNHFTFVGEKRPDDPDIPSLVASVDAYLGDLARLREKPDDARRYRNSELAILSALLRQHPGDAETQESINANTLAFARISLAKGDVTDAVSALRKGLAKTMELEKTDSQNVDLARQTRIVALFLAKALLLTNGRSGEWNEAAELIGDCRTDLKLPSNDEEYNFCLTVEARRLSRTGVGSDGGAEKFLAAHKLWPPGRFDQLTQRWGLDLAVEASEARHAQSGR